MVAVRADSPHGLPCGAPGKHVAQDAGTRATPGAEARQCLPFLRPMGPPQAERGTVGVNCCPQGRCPTTVAAHLPGCPSNPAASIWSSAATAPPTATPPTASLAPTPPPRPD